MSVRVLLVGMMASGKSTVGRALSAQTGWPYVDNDELVARLAGQATPDVAAVRGPDALHLLEGLVVEEILAMEPPVVAGIPGSAVVTDTTRQQLREGGFVVWLRARMETLAARVGDGASRPFFAGHDVLETLKRLNEGREPLYAAAAHLVVDVDDRTPDDVATLIRAALADH
ncbi:MAG TPA: shikimate kinase [Candidatus Nanopelagicales bacterium]|nr:shikimate kinase [Candidatus Nanopelagicales bacterium]